MADFSELYDMIDAVVEGVGVTDTQGGSNDVIVDEFIESCVDIISDDTLYQESLEDQYRRYGGKKGWNALKQRFLDEGRPLSPNDMKELQHNTMKKERQDLRAQNAAEIKNKLERKTANQVIGTNTGKAIAAQKARQGKISKLIENMDRTIDKASKNGNVKAMGAAGLVAATAAGAIVAGNALLRKNNSLESRIKKLQKSAAAVKKQCDAGEISEKQAKLALKKIAAEIKTLEKTASAEEKKAAVKESAGVDMNDVLIEIYESCESGDITEEERDVLLELACAEDDDE